MKLLLLVITLILAHPVIATEAPANPSNTTSSTNTQGGNTTPSSSNNKSTAKTGIPEESQNNKEQADTPARNPQVTLETSMGNIILELYPEKAPNTVENFLAYVDNGFYNNTIFHRVVRSFVIQGGGFDTNMQKKPVTRPNVDNESNNRLNNDRGTIAMARMANPDSANSQFYINIGMNLSLDYRFGKPGYTVFGKVVEGMNIAKKINRVKTTNLGGMSDVPEKPVVLLRAYRSFKLIEQE